MNTANLKKIWNREAKSYRFKNNSQPDYKANFYHLASCFGEFKKKKVLEVGSGTGQTSANLASEGADIHLVDISKKSLNFAKKYYASKKLPVHLYFQNAFKMKFRKETFDLVWNGGVIEHFSDAEKVEMIRKMWKLVKPGGKMIITAPNAHDIFFMIAKRILILRKKWPFGYEDDLTICRMRSLAQKANLKKFSIYAYNPIVGLWFFPYGKEITSFLGLNKLIFHKMQSHFGHVIILCAVK